MNKTYFTKSIETDDGKVIIRSGWYYTEAPYAGGSVCQMTLDLSEVAESEKVLSVR